MSGRKSMSGASKLMIAVPVLFAAALCVQASPRHAWPAQEQSTSDTQSQSISDAARRSREQAKNATKPSKVITDDDLEKKNVKPGQQGLTVDAPAKLETQPPAPGAVATAKETPAVADPTVTPAATDDAEIAGLKESIADAEKDADLGKRELALEQDSYLANPDHEHDTAGKAKIDALQQQINDKQQDIDRLKTRLAAMQELHKAPPPPAKPANPPANQTPAAAPPAQQ